MPRYVILQHETASGLHFDFMLEAGNVLRTWSLAHAPAPGVEIDARTLADHRLAYLDYEGPISGDRGSVTRWDSGTYAIETESESEITLRLTGEILSGRATVAKKGGSTVFHLI
jgi:hypothetical protein